MAKELIAELRDFPSVEELLQDPRLTSAVSCIPRPLAADIVRAAVAGAKRQLQESKQPQKIEKLVDAVIHHLTLAKRREISPVINATGILVHTNLGRAPLNKTMFDSVRDAVTGYSNLEFDVATGERGSRGEACEKYLALLTEAESVTVVNNCAAALLLILNTFANRKSVVVSRGELVQIGGGFRIPDVLKRSGARLIEVGTSNITTISDYAQAIDPGVTMLLKVHKSNFVQSGFTDEVALKPLAALGKAGQLLVVHDLGNGLVVEPQDILGHAGATVQQSVRDGASLTCFSADKMLGGIQAGIIAGDAALIAQLKKNPLFRAVRVDKIVFAMLETVARAYLDGAWPKQVRLWALAQAPVNELEDRARAILERCGNPFGLTVVGSQAYVGGGALPEATLESAAIRFEERHSAASLVRRFRDLTPPVVGRIADNCLLLDLKAIDPSEDESLAASIKHILS